ncbi:MAG: hypothetical protein KY455_03910 [Euryarchaeota archaeon]|nr:hypothetical protein [Euryarchaeota archaeon]
MTKCRGGVLLLLTVLFVLGTGAGTGASADSASDVSITVAIEPLAEPIMPITDQVETPVTVTLGCDSPADAGERPLLLNVTGPSWAVAELDPPGDRVALNITDCVPASDHVYTTTLRLTLAATAPAYGPIPVNVTATYGEATGKGGLNATVAYYENIDAGFVRSVFKTGQGSTVMIPLHVENHGNGAIVVTTAIADTSSGLLNVTLPDPFTVAANKMVTVPVDVATPAEFGYENRKDAVHLTLRAAPEQDPDAVGEPITITAIIQTQGLSTGGTAGSIGAAALGTVVFAALVLGAVMLYRSRSSS